MYGPIHQGKRRGRCAEVAVSGDSVRLARLLLQVSANDFLLTGRCLTFGDNSLIMSSHLSCVHFFCSQGCQLAQVSLNCIL